MLSNRTCNSYSARRPGKNMVLALGHHPQRLKLSLPASNSGIDLRIPELRSICQKASFCPCGFLRTRIWQVPVRAFGAKIGRSKPQVSMSASRVVKVH